MTNFNFSQYLLDRGQMIEQALSDAVPEVYPPEIVTAMRYSLLAGGKRLRPILCLASCELVGGTVPMAMPTACALEMIHTMSLIHDDLPAMDNDDLRRGKPTNHKMFGEAMAILAGDALLAYSFGLIAGETKAVPPDRVLKAIEIIAHSASHLGLVGGQVVDLAMEDNPNAGEEVLHYIHTHKTGALLKACVLSGGILGGGNDQDLTNLTIYADSIGLAFQIVDDILDVTSTSDKLGKTAGKDIRDNKVTYPKLWGLERSQQKAKELITQAKAVLDEYGDGGKPLQALADYIVQRDR
jgi:geranylgeranyl diphosphate synthase type II